MIEFDGGGLKRKSYCGERFEIMGQSDLLKVQSAVLSISACLYRSETDFFMPLSPSHSLELNWMRRDQTKVPYSLETQI